jgi:hypothetical protein|tara:strand:+ start:82 stop:825 length:744 start_codon:yes stop_codon:yes gene_type:complete
MTSNQTSFLGASPLVTNHHVSVLPVSVIDVEKSKRGSHKDGESSRAGYSTFPPEVSDLCYELFLRDSTHVFDPFAGWGDRHAKALEHGVRYTGYDVSGKSIAKAKEDYGVDNVLADSLTAGIPSFDGLLTCPPYWNLEVYSQDGLEKAKTFAEFGENLRRVFERCYAAADVGAKICVMVGNWRKKGVYYDLSFMTKGIFQGLGATTIDCVIISRIKKTKISIMLPQAKRLGYTVNLHEELLVFEKTI